MSGIESKPAIMIKEHYNPGYSNHKPMSDAEKLFAVVFSLFLCCLFVTIIIIFLFTV